MKKYQELERRIAELQQEVEKLKVQEGEELPVNFKREVVLDILYDPMQNYGCLDTAFDWQTTPQGGHYWCGMWNRSRFFSDKDIIQLQKWVIISYQKQYED